jgi:hypothetical protein
MKPTEFPINRLFTTALLLGAFGLAAQAQDWQVLDTFDDGVPQSVWTPVGTPAVNTANGFLDLTLNPGNTSTIRVALPETITGGQFSIAFDLYLPSGERQNAIGFGAGGPVHLTGGGWTVVGERNRFQAVNAWPQNVAKVPQWSSDIFGEKPEKGTRQGVWYNVWLVYDLDATPMTVTAVTKKAADPMLEEYLVSNAYDFNEGSAKDTWEEINFFGFGIGNFDGGQTPEGLQSYETLGMLADNIYFSSGVNTSLTPTAFKPEWVAAETFAAGAPEAEWVVEEGVTVTVDGRVATIFAGEPYSGAILPLPLQAGRGSMTVTFDMLLPATGTLDNTFGVVSESLLAEEGLDRFGNAHFFSFPEGDGAVLNSFQPPFDDLLAPTVLDQWYHVWLVYDNSAQRVDFYAVPVPEEGEAEAPAAPAGSFNWTLGAGADLTHLIIGAGDFEGGEIKLANIYQSLDTNLSLSPTAGDFGGEPPLEPANPWEDVVAAEHGFKDTGIGWILDVDFPYVWHVPSAGFLYIVAEGATPESIFGWSYPGGFWFWTADDLGGWHYNLEDSEYGVMGWDGWLQ